MYTNSFDYMQLNKQIIQNTMLDQPLNLALTHMSKLLGYIQSKQYDGNDPIQMSGTIKRSDGHHQQHHHINKDKNRQSISNEHNYKQINWKLDGNVQTNLSSWDLHREKFQLCGISFGPEISSFVQMHLRDIAVKEKSVDIRFWGVIRGTQQDYYIIQARKQPYKSNDQVPVGAQKNGQGANYYTYYVTNNISTSKWTQLPQIQPSHIQTARQIKKLFTGNLDQQIHSNPSFKGRQKHYLKAQIVRITHALQLSPKGIYKPNDQNPKIIEYEQQVKVPDFAELNSLQSWVHKNQMILNLGRCTHFVDPKFSQEQIEAKMNELVEKDPEPERLKGITQDKVPEELGLGVQNPWILKVVGNNQVFTKDDASLVYGVILLRNIYWPGWTTIGYKNGFASIYIGNGLKSTQPSLNLYQNPDLQKQGLQVEEYPEPNPKQLPKVQPVVEGEPKPEDE